MSDTVYFKFILLSYAPSTLNIKYTKYYSTCCAQFYTLHLHTHYSHLLELCSWEVTGKLI
jgi:hypothetical protein